MKDEIDMPLIVDSIELSKQTQKKLHICGIQGIIYVGDLVLICFCVVNKLKPFYYLLLHRIIVDVNIELIYDHMKLLELVMWLWYYWRFLKSMVRQEGLLTGVLESEWKIINRKVVATIR